MKCGSCGEEVSEEWEFCPRCGARIRKNDMFSDAFDMMEKEMSRLGNDLSDMDNPLEKNFEVFDLSPFFRKRPRGSGFSIKITRGSGKKPSVSVKTFGDVNRKDIEKEMRKMGIGKSPEPEGSEINREDSPERTTGEPETSEAPKVTEEPETEVRRVGDRIVVEIKIPGVKETKDIHITSLENSVEVKAIAGKKAYFKILTKPPDSSVVNKDFSEGVLRLELG